VLVLTLNEADNLPRCLDALAWCDDIVVLDSGSADGTREIARARGARVLERPFDDFAGQRNFGIDEGAWRHDWILHLDADEVVTPALVDELDRRTGREDFLAYRLPSRLMFMGRWLRHCGDYPAYQVRLGRRDALRFRQVGHGQREALEAHRIGTFETDYLHFSFSKGLGDWFARHNRYSDDEAAHALALAEAGGGFRLGDLLRGDRTTRRRALKDLVANLPLRGTLRLVYLYVLRGGFMDGRAGWIYCRMMSVYEQMIALKGAYARSGGDDSTPRSASSAEK
jgi:glycosyltransferase involved in cell wall biosynthesis